jgi:hypothetical protein
LARTDSFAFGFDDLIHPHISAARLVAELNAAPAHGTMKPPDGEAKHGPEYGGNDLKYDEFHPRVSQYSTY